MQLLKKMLGKLNGLHYTQEYLCFAKETFDQSLFIYIVNQKRIVKNITNHHLFVGYCPLIFALPFYDDWEPTPILHLIFSPRLLQPNEFFKQKDAIATINLKLVQQQHVEGNGVFYYEGTNGVHHFLSKAHQWINSVNNNLYNKKPGNVFLHDNLYKQVQAAYALPRIIALITVGYKELFNLFPTDLHGQINTACYIISLRHGGKANEQVMQLKQLVIAQVNAAAYKMVYGLGKNHMQSLKEKSSFPFSQSVSAQFNLPLPNYTIAYKELQLIASFTNNIHHLMLFKIVNEQPAQPNSNTLAHIHNTYATWRYKNKLTGNYLLR